MKISVVMPVYNGGERMRRTIDSVLAQTWRDFEFLCIDDGSTDGVSGAVYETFISMKDSPEERWRFTKGSQKFQTYAMMKAGRVSWWPSKWVCSFKRHCVPLFPLNKIFTPWRPSKHSAVVAFHGHPDMVQALRGYYLKANGVPVSVHLTCKPCSWIEDYWHE